MRVLKNARLIDGTGAAPVEAATIVVRGNTIEEVTTRNHSDFPAEAQIVDLAGKTLLPGLIDCHDHMANHRYDLAHRWGLDEPASTRHLRGHVPPDCNLVWLTIMQPPRPGGCIP